MLQVGMPTSLPESIIAQTIAGHDPSSGAGMTADMLVFAAHGLFATSAITALTVQSTTGVQRVEPVSPQLLRQTLDCLEADLPPNGIKIGMLATAGNVSVVADYIANVRARRSLLVVLDPVLRSSSGTALLDHEGYEAVAHLLLPSVDAITPNLQEAELLSGLPCLTWENTLAAAKALRERYANLAVIVTGGHLPAPADLLLHEAGPQWFHGERIHTRATHGTGCAFSSALLANRLLGADWSEATAAAKQFVADAMRQAVPRGQGSGPMALFQTRREGNG